MSGQCFNLNSNVNNKLEARKFLSNNINNLLDENKNIPTSKNDRKLNINYLRNNDLIPIISKNNLIKDRKFDKYRYKEELDKQVQEKKMLQLKEEGKIIRPLSFINKRVNLKTESPKIISVNKSLNINKYQESPSLYYNDILIENDLKRKSISKEKKSQLIYRNILEKQIQEKKIRLENERIQRIQEDIKVEQEFLKSLEKEKNQLKRKKVEDKIPLNNKLENPTVEKQSSIFVKPNHSYKLVHSLTKEYKKFKDDYLSLGNNAKNTNLVLRDSSLQQYLKEMTDKYINKFYTSNLTQLEMKNKCLNNDVYLYFWTDHINILNKYITRIEEIMKERDNVIKETFLMKEKFILFNNLRNEKDKIKEKIVFSSKPKPSVHLDMVKDTNNSIKINALKNEELSNIHESTKIKTDINETVNLLNEKFLENKSKFLKLEPKTNLTENDKEFYETWKKENLFIKNDMECEHKTQNLMKLEELPIDIIKNKNMLIKINNRNILNSETILNTPNVEEHSNQKKINDPKENSNFEFKKVNKSDNLNIENYLLTNVNEENIKNNKRDLRNIRKRHLLPISLKSFPNNEINKSMIKEYPIHNEEFIYKKKTNISNDFDKFHPIKKHSSTFSQDDIKYKIKPEKILYHKDHNKQLRFPSHEIEINNSMIEKTIPNKLTSSQTRIKTKKKLPLSKKINLSLEPFKIGEPSFISEVDIISASLMSNYDKIIFNEK